MSAGLPLVNVEQTKDSNVVLAVLGGSADSSERQNERPVRVLAESKRAPDDVS